VAERDSRRIVDREPALVGYWNSDLRNLQANGACMRFFGRLPAALRGRHISELLGPELFEQHRPHIERALAGEPQLFDCEIPARSGKLRRTKVSYLPDASGGEVRGFFVLASEN
jgi:PAS domain S-box-containing protein